RDAAGQIQEHEVLDVPRAAPHRLRQQPEHASHRVGIRLEHTHEVRATERKCRRVGDRLDRCRARRLVEQLELAEAIPAALDREANLEGLLRGVPYLRDLDRVSFARLLGALEEVSFPAGALIAEEGESADALYLLEEGGVRVTVHSDAGEVEVADMTAPAYFGELGLLLSRRTGSIRATTDVRLWRMPRERFEALVRERPQIGLSVAKTLAQLLDRRQRSLVGAPLGETDLPATPVEQAGAGRRGLRSAYGLAIALAVPLALWWLPPPAGLDQSGWRVVAILLGAAVAWPCEPLPHFL